MNEEEYYRLIKETIIKNEVYCRVKDYTKNIYDLETRYNIGRLLVEAQGNNGRAKYGDELIKKYSIRLISEVNKKYSVTSLKRMRQFYFIIEKGALLAHQLSWSHYSELLPIGDVNVINYYINRTISHNLSRNSLRTIIKSKEYERLPEEAKLKLISGENIALGDNVPNPIMINNPNNREVIKEKTLQLLIMEDLYSFLKELGDGFAYVGNEYPIKIGCYYNYIDLLLFNYKFNSFVVVELKITELKKEHIGQIQVYMNYIDENIKENVHDKTIGIIIVRKNNKYVIEYSSDKRIISREYILNN